jgi:hypothetical protein
MRNFARIVAVLLAFALPLAMAAEPPASIGRWTLNLTKSKYEPASTAPRSETLSYEMVGGSTKLTARIETADGQVVAGGGTYKADGKPYPLSGNPDFDALTVRRLNRWEARGTLMQAGKVVGHVSSVTSRDGKTYTMTTTLTTASGQKTHSVAVFDRQQ